GAAAAPPPTPTYRLVGQPSAPALLRSADRARSAMQTSLADLVARMGALLDGQRAGCVRVGGLRGSAPALCLARVRERRVGPVVVTCASAGEAEAFAADLRFFLGEPPGAGPLGRRVHHLPAREVPPFEALSPAREAVAAHLEGFYHLVHTPAPIVVTSAEAWIERCLPRATFAGAVRPGGGGSEPARPPGHRAAPSLSLRGAGHARRLPARGDAPLDAGGGCGRGGGRDGLGADRGACGRGRSRSALSPAPRAPLPARRGLAGPARRPPAGRGGGARGARRRRPPRHHLHDGGPRAAHGAGRRGAARGGRGAARRLAAGGRPAGARRHHRVAAGPHGGAPRRTRAQPDPDPRGLPPGALGSRPRGARA